MVALNDTFDGAAGPLHGRVAPTGQTWADYNDSCRIDGSGRFVRGGDTSHGSYLATSIDAPITRMWADISFTGTSADITENGSVVLISSSDPDRTIVDPPYVGIYDHAIHAVFGLWQTTIEFYNHGALELPRVLVANYAEPLAADGTIYRIGLTITGQRVTVDLPDGQTKYAADSRLALYTGRHLIYQIYDNVSPDLDPRIEQVWADSEAVALSAPIGVELPY